MVATLYHSKTMEIFGSVIAIIGIILALITLTLLLINILGG